MDCGSFCSGSFWVGDGLEVGFKTKDPNPPPRALLAPLGMLVDGSGEGGGVAVRWGLWTGRGIGSNIPKGFWVRATPPPLRPPLWEVILVRRFRSGSALIFRQHHCPPLSHFGGSRPTVGTRI